jgi:tetratricopeptide (TPR) repeat protein
LYYKKQYDEALFAYSNLLLISAKNVVQMLKYEFPVNLKQPPTRNEIIDGLKLYIKKRLAGEDLKAESEPVEEETKQQKTIEDPHKKKGKQDKSGVQFHVMARREVEESIARCLMQLGAIDVAADYFEALVQGFKDDPNYWNIYSSLRWKLKRPLLDCLEGFQKSIQLNVQLTDSWLSMGLIYVELKKHSFAKKSFQRLFWLVRNKYYALHNQIETVIHEQTAVLDKQLEDPTLDQSYLAVFDNKKEEEMTPIEKFEYFWFIKDGAINQEEDELEEEDPSKM